VSGVAVLRFDELEDGEARRVDVDGTRVCLVRIGERVYAIGDRCTHADVSLSEGEVDSDELTIECPKHGSEFSLESGDALSLPAVKPTPTYEVSVIDGAVVVELSVAGSATSVDIDGRAER
jgi:3-phenylpropionate/trans-cinnamate dioxygenase ferredoxin subunit